MNDQQTISELRKQADRLQSERNELRLRNVALLSRLCETNGALLLANERERALVQRLERTGDTARLKETSIGTLAWCTAEDARDEK